MPIDDEIANLTIAELLHLLSEGPDNDISVYINCPGGSVYAGLAIYEHDAVRQARDPDDLGRHGDVVGRAAARRRQ
jgi:ATP-dependent protease ClpP protease subunit